MTNSHFSKKRSQKRRGVNKRDAQRSLDLEIDNQRHFWKIIDAQLVKLIETKNGVMWMMMWFLWKLSAYKSESLQIDNFVYYLFWLNDIFFRIERHDFSYSIRCIYQRVIHHVIIDWDFYIFFISVNFGFICTFSNGFIRTIFKRLYLYVFKREKIFIVMTNK